MSPHSSNERPYASREDQARAEIGVMEVGKPVAVALVAFFLALLLAGLGSVLSNARLRRELAAPFHGLGAALANVVGQKAGAEAEGGLFHTFRGVEQATLLERLLAPNRVLRQRLVGFETALDHDFPAAVSLRIPVQTALSALGTGDEQVFVGHGGWLYYRPDVTALTGPGIASTLRPNNRRKDDRRKAPDAPQVEVVATFAAELAQHGVRLVILPTPVKPAVHPEGLSRRRRDGQAEAGTTNLVPILRVRGFAAWAERLRDRGVDVVDAAPTLTGLRSEHHPAYLHGDTHWRPEAMDAVAAALADHVRSRLPEARGPRPAEQAPCTVSNCGDTAMMLALPDRHPLRARETVVTRPVANARSNDAAMILLGDSFSNIYSLEAMGWGTDAGLAERLALHLGQPVRPFVRNDGGAWASRERFAQAVARGELRLDQVRVVVWQFAERELAHGDWRAIPLAVPPADRPSANAAVAPPLPRESQLTGTLTAISDGPRRDAPYADFIVKWHVTNLREMDGTPLANTAEAVVLTLGMKQRTILPTAALRSGAHVTMTLRPWSQVEPRYGTLNAGTLDDPMLELDLPLFWAEGVEVTK